MINSDGLSSSFVLRPRVLGSSGSDIMPLVHPPAHPTHLSILSSSRFENLLYEPRTLNLTIARPALCWAKSATFREAGDKNDNVCVGRDGVVHITFGIFTSLPFFFFKAPLF